MCVKSSIHWLTVSIIVAQSLFQIIIELKLHVRHKHLHVQYMHLRYTSQVIFRGCRISTSGRYVVRCIYIIRVPTRNRNNEFILLFILREIKMADFKHRQLEIGLEFVH